MAGRFNPLDPLGIFQKRDGSFAEAVSQTRHNVSRRSILSIQEINDVLWPPPDPLGLFALRPKKSENPGIIEGEFWESGTKTDNPGLRWLRWFVINRETGASPLLIYQHGNQWEIFSFKTRQFLNVPVSGDVKSNLAQFIEKMGYPAEKYQIVSEAPSECLYHSESSSGETSGAAIGNPIPIEWADQVIPLKNKARETLLSRGYSPQQVDMALHWGEEWLAGIARRVAPNNTDTQKLIVVSGYADIADRAERWLRGIEGVFAQAGGAK